METATVYTANNGSPAAFKAVIHRLNELCRQKLKGYDEGICYGMPAYKRNGVPELAFDFRDNCLKLYVMKHDLLNRFRQQLRGLSIGKGCIWFTRPEDLDFDVIGHILDTICGSSRTAH
ncbi:DUF1801 domain-containing protein [Pedobacter yulinensis]|uniref:DUF1801 domain-containing protein n=1 Tax=Pedobacter yulinensis TaxID=2126353 RepID=A0A2T3HIC0_9SPHI|nr:DUF1801 domain-containing protein [Pedobacter yulinensis]PST82196.1 DUF1801 domain-containing protein [Pedobacter yulinensis]